MTINELIKKAGNDRELRSRLLNDPIKTCKALDINFKIPENLKLFQDESIIQGGYRP